MDPKDIYNLIEKSLKDGERTEVCQIVYSDFKAFNDAYPNLKGFHYNDNSLVITSYSEDHERIIWNFSRLIFTSILDIEPDLELTGRAQLLFTKYGNNESKNSVGSVKHDNLKYLTIILEVSYTNQTYNVFRNYLKDYFTWSPSNIKYVIGIYFSLNSYDLFNIVVIQSNYSKNDYVENVFQIGNDPIGEENSNSSLIMTFDRQIMFPEKSYSKERQFVDTDLKAFRSKILLRLVKSQVLKESRNFQ